MTNKRLKDILTDLGTDNVPAEVHELAEQLSTDFVKDLPQEQTPKIILLWEKIMRSGKTKLAAAITICGSVLAVLFSNYTVAPVYALEQTVEALHSVRFLHVKEYTPEYRDPHEVWIVCDDLGQPVQIRAHIPAWHAAAGEEGGKEVVWQHGTAQVWLKEKGLVVTTWEADRQVSTILDRIIASDPRRIVDRVQEMEKQHLVTTEISQSSDKSKPILITVSYLSDDNDVKRQEVLHVDQATHLVEKIERHHRVNDQWQYQETLEFHDYNQSIDPQMFVLDNLPEDVTLIDFTDRTIGLAQGTLSEPEIAVKVVRQCLEALVMQDYDRVGKLMSGIPEEKIRDMYGHVRFLRVVAIGQAVRFPLLGISGWSVPCEIEIEKNGETAVVKFPRIATRPVEGQPSRWVVTGGI
ncbi:hypothetical protein ACFL6U_12480 [Planctomycetota bacterium]